MAKLFTNADNAQSFKALVAARYTGFPLEVPAFNYGVDNTTEEYIKTKHPLGKVPVLQTADGLVLFEAPAIARFIARNTPLYGTTPFETALVDQWVDFCLEIDMPAAAWVLPLLTGTPACAAAVKKAKGDVRRVLGVLNTHLLTRTFLVGERVTLADIAVACSLLDLYKRVLDAGFRKEFRNTNRWFATVVNQPQFKAVAGEVRLCEKAEEPKYAEAAAAAPCEKKEKKEQAPKKEQPKPQPKKEEKKEAVDDEEEDDMPKEKKNPNPLDLLPPSKMVMDNWKRTYSNEDTKTVAIPWLWENYDAEGFSMWFCDYKYPIEQEQIFMVCNLVGGFIQRLDALRKYGFGSVCIFNDAKPFDIHGFFLFRGKDIPKEMLDCDDYELYNWRRVDLSSAADKQLVEDFLTWEGPFTGFPKFNQGKIFK